MPSRFVVGLTALLVAAAWVAGTGELPRARAVGARTAIELRQLELPGQLPPRPTAMQRLAWEVRQRTSVDTTLEPRRVRLSDPGLFDSPWLYLSGDRAFDAWKPAEIAAIRRYVEHGGFLVVDDAAPDAGGFDASVRRELGRAFGLSALRPLSEKHTLYRSFYLVASPAGRVRDPAYVEAIERGGRAAVVYTRHDLGAALERDNVGNYAFAIDGQQRETAFRFGVNLVLYALCLDYKDDQVHAPFLLQRWAGRP